MNIEATAVSDAFDAACSGYDVYEQSIASAGSSTQASIFSAAASAHGSIASSVSDDFRTSHDDARDRDNVCAQTQLRFHAQQGTLSREDSLAKLLMNAGPAQTYADVTSTSIQYQKQHPRRCSSSKALKPPSLVRQRDRKINFVDNLVDSASQMVEVIWPLSVVPCRNESANGRGVLPLRTYIEETLRRSRTSYSTLQVALYYLILIKPHIPSLDFTMEQRLDCPATRSLMCGRRVFLAALILASKYLQDRNYSAKAWSKMSGLKVTEINANERVFLAKINWKLHIPKPTFEKWQEVVLRFTPHPPPAAGAVATGESSWKTIIPILTPELDNLPVPDTQNMSDCHAVSALHNASWGPASPSRRVSSHSDSTPAESTSQEATPTPLSVPPRFLEPQPELVPPMPTLARMGPLPTPQMTPALVASSTPAASACGSRRPSVCSAMAIAQRASLNRCALDTFTADLRPDLSRRPSLASTTSYVSSPESMVSDRLRLSRSSSVSSVSTASTFSSMAPQRACLARQATCRNVRLQLPSPLRESEKEGSVTKPIVIDDDGGLVSSPEMTDFSISDRALHMPHRHSKHAPNPVQAPSAEKCRKRCRPRGNRRSELHEEVRFLLQESLDDAMDLDDRLTASPSPAFDYATSALARCNPFMIATQASHFHPAFSRPDLARIAVQKENGKKRTCCSSIRSYTSSSPSPLQHRSTA